MRAVLQVVSEASVRVDDQAIGSIDQGLLVLLGVGETDSKKEVDYLATKISTLRIFPDHTGQMNKSLQDVGGAMLVVSQFTLYADCRKGRRPSYNQAANPELAKRLYLYFIEQVKALGIAVSCGQFQAMMDVSLINKGPITIILDTNKD